MMQRSIIISLTEQELSQLIQDAVSKALAQERSFKNKAPPDDEYILRSELAKMLRCSLPSVSSYIKHNLIPAKKIGGKYLIKKSDALKALQSINSIKFNRNKT